MTTYLRDVTFLVRGIDKLCPTQRTRGRIVEEQRFLIIHMVESVATRKNHLVLVVLKLLHTDGTSGILTVTSLELVKLNHSCFPDLTSYEVFVTCAVYSSTIRFWI